MAAFQCFQVRLAHYETSVDDSSNPRRSSSSKPSAGAARETQVLLQTQSSRSIVKALWWQVGFSKCDYRILFNIGRTVCIQQRDDYTKLTYLPPDGILCNKSFFPPVRSSFTQLPCLLFTHFFHFYVFLNRLYSLSQQALCEKWISQISFVSWDAETLNFDQVSV